MTKNAERFLLSAVLVAFALLSTTYSLIVPPFEASDELWHYPMVKTIADNWSLPVQDPADVGPWRQEGSQPPLYYTLGALSTFWIDTSDMPEVRHLNPHVDNGIVTPDGNANLVVHKPGREAFPWEGTILAIHVVRFLSILMATAGVYLTYLITREVLPGRPALTLGATAIHAFTPMVVFIAGSVNNDNLVVPLSSLALLVLLRLLRRQDGPFRSAAARYVLLGIVLGLAALTKASSLGLTLLTALVVSIRALRRRRCPADETGIKGWHEFVTGGLLTLLPLVIIAGWWYLRNLRLYGDLTGLNAFIEILGKRDVPAGLAQLWRERYSFLVGYWGNFGGLNVPMSHWVYRVLNGVLVIAGFGPVVWLVRSRVRGVEQDRSAAITEESASGIWIPGLILCVLFALAVFIPWIQWARVTWSSQGRLVFAALAAWSMLLALGLGAWLPRRREHWTVGVFALFLLSLSVAAPFVWIRPAYRRPQPIPAEIDDIPSQMSVDFGDTMRLLGYDLEDEATSPGGQAAVTLFWEALAPTDVDHTVFVHLLGDHDLVVAQRDTFPGLGLISTTWLEPGFRWADRYVLQVPPTAYAPNQTQIEVGLFDARTGQRLPAVTRDGEQIGDNVRYGAIEIQPSPDAPPNPISINFGGRMHLTGYDLSMRIAQPGEPITLTLRWDALRPMKKDYTVSAQLVDRAQHKAAQHDSPPLNGAAPTTSWEPNQTLVDTIPLTVFADAPPGAYAVRVAAYAHDQGTIVHLPVTPPGGQMQADHVTLTEVRITP